MTRDDLIWAINQLDRIMGEGVTGHDPMLGLDYGTAEEWADNILLQLNMRAVAPEAADTMRVSAGELERAIKALRGPMDRSEAIVIACAQAVLWAMKAHG